jgi:hypothetical protein
VLAKLLFYKYLVHRKINLCWRAPVKRGIWSFVISELEVFYESHQELLHALKALEIEGDSTRLQNTFDQIEPRYVNVRYIPESLKSDDKIQSRKYTPAARDLFVQSPQLVSAPLILGGTDAICDEHFDPLIFTIDAE